MKKLLPGFLLLLATSLYSCKKIAPNHMLSRKFDQVIKENTSGYVALDTVVKGFAWDMMCIKGPYSATTYGELRNRIDNLYQLDLSENDHTDGLIYLIFVSKGEAVAYFKIPQAPCCVFSGFVANPACIPKEKAVFKIVKEVYKSGIEYVLSAKIRF